jgi:hypothetical protein
MKAVMREVAAYAAVFAMMAVMLACLFVVSP